MANSIWRARTRERLVVLTGEEVRYEGGERGSGWSSCIGYWLSVNKGIYLGPLQENVCICLQVFRYIQQVNETKKEQLQSSDNIPTSDQHHKYPYFSSPS